MQSRPPDYPNTDAKYVIAPGTPGTHLDSGKVQTQPVIQPGESPRQCTVSRGSGHTPTDGSTTPFDLGLFDLVLQDSFIEQTGGDVNLNPALVRTKAECRTDAAFTVLPRRILFLVNAYSPVDCEI